MKITKIVTKKKWFKMTREKFIKITKLDEYEIYLNGKKKINKQLKINKIFSKVDSERMNRLQTGDAIESEASSPIQPISSIDREQPPRWFGKSKEILKLNKKLGTFKTYRMNRNSYENQSKAVSGTGRVKSNETI